MDHQTQVANNILDGKYDSAAMASIQIALDSRRATIEREARVAFIEAAKVYKNTGAKGPLAALASEAVGTETALTARA